MYYEANTQTFPGPDGQYHPIHRALLHGADGLSHTVTSSDDLTLIVDVVLEGAQTHGVPAIIPHNGGYRVEYLGVMCPRLSYASAIQLAKDIYQLSVDRDPQQARIRLASKCVIVGVNE